MNPDHAPDAAPHELERLSAYLDGELTRDERAELERDLAADDALRARLEELSATDAALDAWLVEPASEDFVDRVVRAAVVETATGAAPRPWIWTAAAAAAVLVAGLTWQLGTQDPLSRRDPTTGTVELSERELEAIARDLDVIANLEALEATDDEALIRLADDLDLLDDLGPADPTLLGALPEQR